MKSSETFINDLAGYLKSACNNNSIDEYKTQKIINLVLNDLYLNYETHHIYIPSRARSEKYITAPILYERYNNGERVVNLARRFDLNENTIYSQIRGQRLIKEKRTSDKEQLLNLLLRENNKALFGCFAISFHEVKDLLKQFPEVLTRLKELKPNSVYLNEV